MIRVGAWKVGDLAPFPSVYEDFLQVINSLNKTCQNETHQVS